MHRIELARREALDAYQRSLECIDNSTREEWLKAAKMWDAIAAQYEKLLNIEARQIMSDNRA
jgi:hypothetical protein